MTADNRLILGATYLVNLPVNEPQSPNVADSEAEDPDACADSAEVGDILHLVPCKRAAFDVLTK